MSLTSRMHYDDKFIYLLFKLPMNFKYFIDAIFGICCRVALHRCILPLIMAT